MHALQRRSVDLSLSPSSSRTRTRAHTRTRTHTQTRRVRSLPFVRYQKSPHFSRISPNDERPEDSIADRCKLERSDARGWRTSETERAECQAATTPISSLTQGAERRGRFVPRGMTKRPESAMDSRHLIATASVPLPPLLPPSLRLLLRYPSTASRSRSTEASTHSHVSRLPNSNVSPRIRSKGTKNRAGDDRGNETYSRDDDVTGCTVLGRLSADAEPGLSRATLSRRLPPAPAPTRGRQSLRVLVPHCRRSWSNGRAQMNGHL